MYLSKTGLGLLVGTTFILGLLIGAVGVGAAEAQDKPCCWYVPKGQPCHRCRDASVMRTINPDVRTICRTKWRPLPYKANAYCVRYGGSLWLCPVEVCEWKQI